MPHRYRRNGAPPQQPPLVPPGQMAPQTAAAFAATEQRLLQTERDVGGLRQQIAELANHFDQQFAGLSAKTDSQFATIAAKLDERSKIPWQAVGIFVATLTVLGGVLWYPINQGQTEAKDRITRIETGLVPRVEHEREWMRAARQVEKLEAKTESNSREMVRADVYAVAHADLVRQVEDIRRTFGSTYSLKDALADMQRRLDRLEFERTNGGLPKRSE